MRGNSHVRFWGEVARRLAILSLQKRFQKHINHEISRQLVNNAVASKRAISLEDLTGIRERTNQQPRSKQERRKSNSWSFYQLRQFLTYKCLLSRIPLIFVNPAYTSKSCHKCLHIGNRNGKSFRCVNPRCTWQGDPDYNGAKNIAALGLSINQPGGSGLACRLKTGNVEYFQLSLFGESSAVLGKAQEKQLANPKGDDLGLLKTHSKR
jgi:putative transposase